MAEEGTEEHEAVKSDREELYESLDMPLLFG